jgi:dihydroneopterin aldolase
MDTIFIEQLTVETVIGVYDWERDIRQKVVLDLEMDSDIRGAATADDVAKTFDYEAMAKRVITFVEASRFALVETLAERIAQLILAEFAIARVTVRLNKPRALRSAAGVGVRITRQRGP